MLNLVPARLHSADWRLLGLFTLTLAGIGFYLGGGLSRLEQSGAGWRRIDTEAVRTLMDGGDLSGREAQWYHPSRPGERTTVPTAR